MRKTGERTPWQKIGISRATWYRHGKPTKKPKPKSRMVVNPAAQIIGQKRRTYQRMLRVLASDLRVRPETSGRIAEFSEHEAD